MVYESVCVGQGYISCVREGGEMPGCRVMRRVRRDAHGAVRYGDNDATDVDA
jgi:hypothetical protein